MRWTIAVYLLGCAVGFWAGVYWPPAHQADPHRCASALTILGDATILQTPQLRTASLLAVAHVD